MASFGGWSQFGGHTDFGGADPLYQRVYRIAKGILLPGFWSDDDDALVNKVLRAECLLLAEGQLHADALQQEVFPHTASETVDEWAALLGVVFPAAATLAEKKVAIVSRWRASLGASLPDLRRTLYPLLKPETAFSTDFDAGIYRFDASGNGTRTVASSYVALTVPNPTDGDWLAGNANTLGYRLHDIDDGWTAQTQIASAATLGTDTAAGLVVFGDINNAVMLVAGDASGTPLLRYDRVVDGTLTTGLAYAAIPSAPYYLQISRSKTSGSLTLSYGADIDSLTELATIDWPFSKLRNVGIFARNVTASKNTVSCAFGRFKLVHETPENNVEIYEQTKAYCDLVGDASRIFEATVIRRPSDSGSCDLATAQRVCDSAKQAHTLIIVGESDEFLCDDDGSLCDRDLLGV